MTTRKVVITVALCAAAAACAEQPVPTEAPAAAFSYGSPGCFPGLTSTQVCQYFHGESAAATSYCMYGDCFEMNQGELVRVVAADEQGEYPKTWFAWGNATLTAAGTEPCMVTAEGRNKTRVEIPGVGTRCLAAADIGLTRYFEHFASRPASQCLGWVECTMPIVPAP